ncbi:MAG TPA: TatD family hydrolase [Clostridia bacterium]|nr:TatD family hydrolase [Clostridia bacterium]
MLFDSHAHLDSSSFDDDRAEVVERAKEAGVSLVMNPSVDLESSSKVVRLAEEYEGIYGAVGIHPHNADTMDEMILSLLEGLAKKEKIKAIGEIGLDYHYDYSPRDEQKDCFIEHLRMAKRLGMPVIIHDREANDDVMRILKEEKAFETGVLLHCYSGSAEMARQYVRLGASISIAGPVTFKNARKLAEVVKTVPLERLLIETDSPFLTPVPNRGKRNEPAFVRFVAQRISLIKEIDFEDVAASTSGNAKSFFGI